MPPTDLYLRYLSGKPPVVSVDGPTTTLAVPSWFGEQTWTIPTSLIGVHDPDDRGPFPRRVEVVFEKRPDVVALETGSPARAPTTSLLFAEPQRMPPTSRRTGRPAEEALVDGVSVTFQDPAAARQVLVQAGAQAVADDVAWWRQRRAWRSDPLELQRVNAAIVAVPGRVRRAKIVAWATLPLCALGGVMVNIPLVALGFAVMVLGVVLLFRAVGGAGREIAAARAEADQRTPFERRS